MLHFAFSRVNSRGDLSGREEIREDLVDQRFVLGLESKVRGSAQENPWGRFSVRTPRFSWKEHTLSVQEFELGMGRKSHVWGPLIKCRY